jgi:RimJ/RimL family protein N-acetyltransferase
VGGGRERISVSATVGAFKGQELAALAGYQLWGEQIAHIAILTHPAFRGQGHATSAVCTLPEMVFERTLVPQYRTLEANAPSLAVATRLGFVQCHEPSRPICFAREQGKLRDKITGRFAAST